MTLTDIFTLGLVIVGVIQAGLFLWQLYLIRASLSEAKESSKAAADSASVAKQSIELARGTAEHQLRAYIFTEKIVVTEIAPAPRIRITFKNGGATPAYDIAVWITTFIAPEDISEEPARPVTSETHRIGHLGPQCCFTITAVDNTNIEQVKAFSGKQQLLFLYGALAYKDIFRETPRSLTFCYFRGGELDTSEIGPMHLFRNWNEAT
jgi:hypothetical protein